MSVSSPILFITLTVVVFIFLEFHTAQGQTRQCTANETYTSPGYECGDCYTQPCVRCAPNETPGCYCKEGYIRLRSCSTRCVLSQDCPVCDAKKPKTDPSGSGCSCAINCVNCNRG